MAKTDQNLVVIGSIMGAHGVRGDVRVKSFTAHPEDLFAYGPLLSKDGQVLITPVAARPAKNHFIVEPEEHRQKEDWDSLKGTPLCVPRDVLPQPDEDEVYVDDLIGLSVIAEDGTPLGKIKAVLNHGASDLLEIAPAGGGKAVLIPFTLADVPDLNMDQGTVTIATFDVWADQSDKPDDRG